VTEDLRPTSKDRPETGVVIELIVERKSLEEIDRGRDERRHRR
jgi:hypothetical protein